MTRRLLLLLPLSLFARRRRGRGPSTGRTGVSRRTAADAGSVFDKSGEALKDDFPGLDPIPQPELDRWFKKLAEYRGYTDTLSAREFYALTLWAYQHGVAVDAVFNELEANKLNAGLVFKKLNRDPKLKFKHAKSVLTTEPPAGNPSASPKPNGAGSPSNNFRPR